MDKSRAIAEESRKLAIQQLNTAISESNKLMAILTDNFNKSENRRLEAATALIDFAIKQVQLIIAKINAQIEYNKGKVQMFAAEAEAYRAVAEAEAAIIRANVDYALGKIKVFIDKLNAKLDFFKAKYGLEIEGYKTILSSATQLTASAWGAVGITASLQASSNEQRQSSISVSEQWSHSETLVPLGIKIEAAAFPVLERRAVGLVEPVRVTLDYNYGREVEALVRVEGSGAETTESRAGHSFL